MSELFLSLGKLYNLTEAHLFHLMVIIIAVTVRTIIIVIIRAAM